MKHALTITLLVIAFLLACEEGWNLNSINFIHLTFFQSTPLSANALTVTVDIEGLVEVNADDHGLVWTDRDLVPTVQVNDGRSFLGFIAKGAQNAFVDTIKGLKPDTRHLVRAYLIIGEETFYSDTLAFVTEAGRVLTLNLGYTGGFSIELTGRITGAEAGIVATQHGFCWSDTNLEPDLNCNCQCVELGNLRSNEPFSYVVEGLQDSTSYYFRSFATLLVNQQQKTVFGEVLSFNGNLKDYWVQKPADISLIRKGAVSFSLMGKGYIGTGIDAAGKYLNDFWAFDPATGIWTQEADFPGDPRAEAVGFALEASKKGYLGTGWDGKFPWFSDFWEYDPDQDRWAQKANFGGGKRYKSAGFAINEKERGYLGSGIDLNNASRSDFWEFDPTDGSQGLDDFGNPKGKWNRVGDLGEIGRADAIAFTIAGKGYCGLGRNSTLTFYKDFWEFDPANNGNWIKKTDFPGAGRADAVAFAVDGEGFIGTGWNEGVIPLKDLWGFDPGVAGNWSRKGDFSGGSLQEAVGFAIGLKGYVCTGEEGSVIKNNLWVYEAR